MKFRVLFGLLLLSACSIRAQSTFDSFFINKTLRINYLISGNANWDTIIVDSYSAKEAWSRGTANLIEPFDYGTLKIRIWDASKKRLLFTISQSSLFDEWRLSVDSQNIVKAFEQVVLIPFPKKKVIVEILKRDAFNQFIPGIAWEIDPDKIEIKTNPFDHLTVKSLAVSGPADSKLDILFIPDGYTKNEAKQLAADMQRAYAYMTSYRPLKKFKSEINFRYVELFSEESGTDDPNQNIYKNTAIDASFNTLGSDRYLMTESVFKLHDIAANAPYDQIIIVVNSNKYGGGGIYNYYSISTINNVSSRFVMNHEFGHAMAGLADEYEGGVTYDQCTKPLTEPWQPNITSLVNFDNKWADLIRKKTPVPTPATKKFAQKTGVFEGANYCRSYYYRPAMDCTMRSVSEDNFCKVCTRAIIQMLNFYTISNIKL